MPLPVKGSIPNAQYERNKKIVAMSRDGVPGVEIAKVYGLSKQRIHAILKDAGMPPFDVNRRRAKVVKLIQEGLTVAEIMAKTGESQPYVLWVTQYFGLKSNLHNVEERARIDKIIDNLKKKGTSIYSQTKNDRPLRMKVYRVARNMGIVFDHHYIRKRQRLKLIQRIMTGD